MSENIEPEPEKKRIRGVQKGEKLACLTKIGGIFDQKFRLHRLLPRTDLLTWIPARMTSQLVVHRGIYIH